MPNTQLGHSPAGRAALHMSASLIGRLGQVQAIHHSSVDVAYGLVLLFGLGTKSLMVARDALPASAVGADTGARRIGPLVLSRERPQPVNLLPLAQARTRESGGHIERGTGQRPLAAYRAIAAKVPN